MLSLIICSRHSDISDKLKDNIQKTIIAEYELIVIDNSKNKYSIFSAYNEGVKKAKFPFLCFMHEDILFHTKDWGVNVINHFENQKVGLIGVAGGHFLPKCPSSWNTTNICSFNIIQHVNDGGNYKTEHWEKNNYMKNSKTMEAVVVDGVWFCIRKSLFKLISFDENTFKGFHCYDLDICLQVREKESSVKVVSDILLEHFSMGSLNNDWISNSLILYNKWKDYLPQIAGVSLSEAEINERTELAALIFSLREELIRVRNSKKYLTGKFILKPLLFFRYKVKK